MRTIFFITVTLMLSLNSFSQKTKETTLDTSKICLPYDVAQKILLDLNDYDRLKEVVVTYKNEIYELNNQVVYLKKENESWMKEDKLSQEIVEEKNKSIEIYKSENEDLKKENKRLKTKNGLFNIISGLIIAPLTYYVVFK